MTRCIDFPCCGHELGCCPDYDESGRQLNMVCTCGAKHHGESGTSLCVSCLSRPDPNDPESYDPWESFEEPEEDEDFEADPIEDFGYFGEMGCYEE